MRGTRLSRCAIRGDAGRLQLFALAYNLATCPLRERLIKIYAWIVRHGRYVDFQLVEVAVPRTLVRGDPAAHQPTTRSAYAGDVKRQDSALGEVKGRILR